MRGRRKLKEKAPRARREKITTEGRPHVYCPWMDYRTGVLLKEGSQQSIVYFDDDRSDEFLEREMLMPNTWFHRGTPRVRLKQKVERVTMKRKQLKRVRMKNERRHDQTTHH